MDVKLLSDFKDIVIDVLIVDELKVQFTFFLSTEELALVTQESEKLPVAENVGLQSSQMSGQRTFGIGVLGVELLYFLI